MFVCTSSKTNCLQDDVNQVVKLQYYLRYVSAASLNA